MRPIPEQAKCIAVELRRVVPRPSKDSAFLNEEGHSIRFPSERGECCPMGMHPGAYSPIPTKGDFLPDPSFEGPSIRFGQWWDSLDMEDLEKALNLIWGEI